MSGIIVDNSKVIEFVSETADRVVVEKFGDETYIGDGSGGTRYTEDAQDFFNETYDSIEGDMIRLLGIVIK